MLHLGTDLAFRFREAAYEVLWTHTMLLQYTAVVHSLLYRWPLRWRDSFDDNAWRACKENIQRYQPSVYYRSRSSNMERSKQHVLHVNAVFHLQLNFEFWRARDFPPLGFYWRFFFPVLILHKIR